MRIKEIVIKNFRQYREATLEFPISSQYNLNYILAENGIGKTTLLNAITWCLYDEELHITEGLTDKTLPLITLQTLREMENNQEQATSIRITLEDSISDISFERFIVFRKNEDGEPYEKEQGQKVIIAYKDTDKEPDVFDDEESFNIEVNKRLPYKIQQFFFFDGEQLDTYIANNTGEDIEQTVLDMSQIGLLVTMGKYLDTIGNDLRREVARESSNYAREANEEYEKRSKELRDKEASLKTKRDELEKSKQRVREISALLGDDPDIAELEEERESLIERRKELVGEKDRVEFEIKDFLKRYLTVLNVLPRLREMYDIIKEKEEKKELPPKYDKDELTAMLEEDTCHICGRKLDTESKIYLLELVKRFELGHETGNILNRIYGLLENQIKDASNYKERRDELFSRKSRIEEDIDELVKRITEIDGLVDKYSDKDRIKKLYAERDALEPAIKDADKAVVRAEIENENLANQVNELYGKLQDALEKDARHEKKKKQMVLANRAKNKVDSIISEIKDDIRQQISDEMSDKFFDLMWKDKFQKVEITEKYSASVINNDGLECLGSCSAAERELLALAFTLALHKESGFDGPLVIDTPISRISGQLRVNFAKVLKDVSKEKQIILFITEDEYSTNVRDVFEPCANKKYKFELINEEFVKVGEM